MSPLWRDEMRAGLGPDRLVVARRKRGIMQPVSRAIHPALEDPVAELKALAGHARLTVVLSSHHVRYLVLAWSPPLSSEADWKGYAQHEFASTYGAVASGWEIRLCATGHRAPRVACAVDTALLDSLRGIPALVSVQPYLMAAFNARRHLAGQSAWFVLQEPGRLSLALIANGVWKLIRTRQTRGDWRESLADTLEREAAAADESADRVLLCAEEEPPKQAGRFRVLDLTLPRGAGHASRPHAMVLN